MVLLKDHMMISRFSDIKLEGGNMDRLSEPHPSKLIFSVCIYYIGRDCNVNGTIKNEKFWPKVAVVTIKGVSPCPIVRLPQQNNQVYVYIYRPRTKPGPPKIYDPHEGSCRIWKDMFNSSRFTTCSCT